MPARIRVCGQSYSAALPFADGVVRNPIWAEIQRPEIEEKSGYDVKAAMHALGLLYECQEMLSAGTITWPRPEREFLIRVRTGKYSREKVLSMAQKLFADCQEAAKSFWLPDKVDRLALSRLLTTSYRTAGEAR